MPCPHMVTTFTYSMCSMIPPPLEVFRVAETSEYSKTVPHNITPSVTILHRAHDVEWSSRHPHSNARCKSYHVQVRSRIIYPRHLSRPEGLGQDRESDQGIGKESELAGEDTRTQSARACRES